MERTDTGLGRDAHGPPRRRRFGDRRGDREGEAAASGGNGIGAAETDYGQLLRRPGELPPQQRARQPGRPRMPAPDRFPPPAGRPGSGFPDSGRPGSGFPDNGRPGSGFPGSARPDGIPPNGGPVPGRQYWQPDGRRGPPEADRPYSPQAPGAADRGRPGPGRLPRHQPPGGSLGPPGWPLQAPSAPPRGVQAPAGGARGWAPPLRENPPAAGFPGPAGARHDGPDGRERPGAQPPRGAVPGPAGPVIRQRAKAVPSDRRPGHQPTASTQPASIEPDGVESFARDLRALRVQADLDYPELAERSHFTMKTLASAAGGLRLPTLPVAVAYVRACGGNVTEWEERWQKLAAKEAADAARGGAVGEPQDPAAIAQDRDRDPGEVYVITSAKPRRPGW